MNSRCSSHTSQCDLQLRSRPLAVAVVVDDVERQRQKQLQVQWERSGSEDWHDGHGVEWSAPSGYRQRPCPVDTTDCSQKSTLRARGRENARTRTLTRQAVALVTEFATGESRLESNGGHYFTCGESAEWRERLSE